MKTVQQTSVASDQALELVNLAVIEAKTRGLHISSCVVDVHGRVKAKVVMDNASLLSDELVEKKARTALLGLATDEFGEAVADLDNLKLSMLALEQITLLGGGYPLIFEGEVIGAFAVGGATVEQDIQCAKAVLTKI